jgi:hypothetical protein
VAELLFYTKDVLGRRCCYFILRTCRGGELLFFIKDVQRRGAAFFIKDVQRRGAAIIH